MSDTNNMKECIDMCWSCRDTCQKTLFTHCLPMGGAHVEEEHVKIMLECIDICQIAADFMTRQSPHHGLTCGVCAEICTACADSCDRLDSEHMKECAEICRRCAEHCEETSERTMKQQTGPLIGGRKPFPAQGEGRA